MLYRKDKSNNEENIRYDSKGNGRATTMNTEEEAAFKVLVRILAEKLDNYVKVLDRNSELEEQVEELEAVKDRWNDSWKNACDRLIEAEKKVAELEEQLKEKEAAPQPQEGKE